MDIPLAPCFLKSSTRLPTCIKAFLIIPGLQNCPLMQMPSSPHICPHILSLAASPPKQPLYPSCALTPTYTDVLLTLHRLWTHHTRVPLCGDALLTLIGLQRPVLGPYSSPTLPRLLLHLAPPNGLRTELFKMGRVKNHSCFYMKSLPSVIKTLLLTLYTECDLAKSLI